jgi:TPR repeat protein
VLKSRFHNSFISFYVTILAVCVFFTNTLHADFSPRGCYEMIGNPQVGRPDQHHAYYILKSESNVYGQLGNPDANYYLAECYINGKTGEGGPDYAQNQNGFPPNRPEAWALALPLYENAAQFDHIPSLVKLAALYADGKYVNQNLDKSLTYLVRAAKLGDKASLEKLLPWYSAGFPGINDERQKFMGMEALADRGYPEAQIELSKWLISKDSQKSFDEARGFLVPLADKGNISAVALLKDVETKVNAAREEAQRAAADEALQNVKAEKQKVADQETAEKESRTAKFLFYLFAFVFIGSLLFAIPGTIWGLNEKVVVYNGKLDLALSFIIPVLFLFTFVDYLLIRPFAVWLSWSLKVLSVFLLVYSFRKSFVSNLSIGKTIVVLPTKFILVGLITFCGLFAVGGTLAGIESVEKKKHKEAAKLLAIGAASAVGFYKLKQLIGKLVMPAGTIILNGYKVTLGKLPSGEFRLWINGMEGTQTYPDARSAKLRAVEAVRKMREKRQRRTCETSSISR